MFERQHMKLYLIDVAITSNEVAVETLPGATDIRLHGFFLILHTF